ncbi:adenine deaminase C-terminal domain-containing protein [Ureibacillus sp. FSL K6-8385]|uniref:adenine deaminase n=1 Tax=Ureibacillus terrenus TaxID=118246 RepID=A0A540UXN3_9BACL|nr:adenine deaminase C-terminal domain-containing protein [Ureibacillus terrenus]MED3662477.1 adenine deaminase C-terminal domain-containing protein [Ureibacillus terrenus]MED3764111.1 adenine deaminase C-terminal domain-containing protein [Ureibacillus terrenus]TQE89245.1 adenine deaminase [Ureibacillus terrenus]
MPPSIWKIQEIRDQVAVVEGKKAPTIVLKNARYIHSMLKQWKYGNIWIFGGRIVYAGKEMPVNLDGTEVIDLEGKTVVPGYIEPHVHPFQLYNPESFADYAAQFGTTMFISDNLHFAVHLPRKKAFSIMEGLKALPFSFYWWTRYDSQTELAEEEQLFTNKSIFEWMERDDVLLGGELTGWPRLLRGDDQMLYWIQSSKKKGKKIEGHFPGASEKTLARMKLLGADGDHEAMTIEDVEKRIEHGYGVTLRYSSIRPDLPNLLKAIIEKKLNIFDHIMLTTDGSTPSFHRDGVMNLCIEKALEAGVDPIDAYNMASYNIARYYNLSHLHGIIATGRFATLNILKDEYHPNPESVLSKGIWLKKEGKRVQAFSNTDWNRYYPPLELSFDLKDEDFQLSTPIGIELINDVITKPYSSSSQVFKTELPPGSDESFLILIDKNGKWRINAILKGFATDVMGFASSYSITGDIILIGKKKRDMQHAFEELKKMKGGIVLVENGQAVVSLPLAGSGTFYLGSMDELIEKESALKAALGERGYKHKDAIYTLFFLESIHLPYIRITQKGIFDVMNKEVIIPSVMR